MSSLRYFACFSHQEENTRMKLIKKRWNIQYNDPIKVKVGEIVQILEEEKKPKWLGWLKCNVAGQVGWIPCNIINVQQSGWGKVMESYSAKEVNVDAGDSVCVLKEQYGWLWVKKISDGEEGWIPKDCI